MINRTVFLHIKLGMRQPILIVFELHRVSAAIRAGLARPAGFVIPGKTMHIRPEDIRLILAA